MYGPVCSLLQKPLARVCEPRCREIRRVFRAAKTRRVNQTVRVFVCVYSTEPNRAARQDCSSTPVLSRVVQWVESVRLNNGETKLTSTIRTFCWGKTNKTRSLTFVKITMLTDPLVIYNPGLVFICVNQPNNNNMVETVHIIQCFHCSPFP